MLKKRVVAVIVVKDGITVQSKNFKNYLPVGKPEIAVEFLNQWGVDEIIYADISATKNGSAPAFEKIKKITKKCFVPLTISGGISSIEHMRELMNCGADKVALNQQALHNPELITKAAHIFGDQCIVASVDAVKINSNYFVYDYVKKQNTEIDVADFAKKMQVAGAGEIFINSVDRDGSYFGFDLELMDKVCAAVTIPVIGCGGARNANDFVEIFSKTHVSAAAAANMFHFTEHSVILTKANINKEIPLRIETHADYHDAQFDKDFRLLKKDDKTLEEMLFIKIEKEVI